MAETVEVIRLPEGESGAIQGRLTERVLQSMASYWAIPVRERRRQFGTKDVNDDIIFLASKLGVTRGFVRRSLRDKRLLAAVTEECNAAIVLLMPTILHGQVEKAIEERDTRATELLMRAARWLPDDKKGVQVNVGVQVNNGSSTEMIRQDLENIEFLRQMKETGEIDRLLGIRTVTAES